MSSWPFTSAFHCSLGLNSDAPGNTWTSSPTLAAFASRAMIWTISSRTSPLPPGNWCEARSVTLAASAGVHAATTAATQARIHADFIISSLLLVMVAAAGLAPALAPGLPVASSIVDVDLRILYHLAPALDLGVQEPGELRRRLPAGGGPLFLPHLLHVGRLQRLGDLPVELVGDLLRGSVGHPHGVPRGHVEVAQAELGERRHVGDEGRARRRGDGERPQPARLDLRGGGAHAVEGHVDVAGDE